MGEQTIPTNSRYMLWLHGRKYQRKIGGFRWFLQVFCRISARFLQKYIDLRKSCRKPAENLQKPAESADFPQIIRPCSHSIKDVPCQGEEGVSQKGTKGDRGMGVQAKGTSFSLILVVINKNQMTWMDVMLVFNQKGHWKSPFEEI